MSVYAVEMFGMPYTISGVRRVEFELDNNAKLTDIVGAALIFFIGSKSRDELPAMFLQDEVMTRIGVSNYVEE